MDDTHGMIETVHVKSYVRTKSYRFTCDKYGCYVCWKNFSNLTDVKTHLYQHLQNVIVQRINASWRSQGEIQPLNVNVELIADSLIFELTNATDFVINIKYIGVYNEILQFGKLNPNEFPIKIKQGDKITVRSTLIGLSTQNHYNIVYEDSSDESLEKLQSYHVTLQLDMIRTHCTAQERLPSAIDTPANTSIENSLQARRINHEVLKLDVFPNYSTPPDVYFLCLDALQPTTLSESQVALYASINAFKGPLTPSNYISMLRLMTQIEDCTARLAMCHSTKRNRTLIKKGNTEYVLKLSESEGRPLFLLNGDNIWVGHDDYNNFRINGYVEKVSSEEISLKLQTFNSSLDPQLLYSIHFEVNRLTYLMEMKALEYAENNKIVDLLFPETLEQQRHEKELPNLKYYDQKVKSDFSQMEAVKHIVAGTAYPLPYMLIGYPGTGKTKVIVESICQLFSYPKNRILVCASSNTVCDEIAQKLITLIKAMKLYQTPVTGQYNIIRLYATTVRRSCKGEELLENSNFSDKSIPCLEEIYKYRIVVCTLTVSGRLAQGNIDTNHFTHLFIDECENAPETSTLIPIAGVCSSLGKINPHIVLSGDPKQLGPIVRSAMSKNMHLDVSMFQRLYLSKPYQKDRERKAYNTLLISKLRNNYRSHPALVSMPNQLFYNNEMRTSANTSKIQWLSELDFLPIRGFPMLFEHIEGCTETKENCLSWYNDAEVKSVLYYVDQLLNKQSGKIQSSDIGIISPYKRQCLHIEESLENEGFFGIEVGSVEQFQGKEKPVIIISTVRNGPIGFLQQRERINVMLTRAIGLLIVIGHEQTLCKNADWKMIINYIVEKLDGQMVVNYNGVQEDEEEDEDRDSRC